MVVGTILSRLSGLLQIRNQGLVSRVKPNESKLDIRAILCRFKCKDIFSLKKEVQVTTTKSRGLKNTLKESPIS